VVKDERVYVSTRGPALAALAIQPIIEKAEKPRVEA
jgi:hypothetical protein